MHLISKSKNKKCFSLVEVLLALAFFSLIVTTLVGAFIYGIESSQLSGSKARAMTIAEEGLEAVRNIKEANWTTFSNLTNGDYILSTTGNVWSLTSSPPNGETIDTMFNRKINIADASTASYHKKIITSTVSWQQNTQRTASVSLSSEMSSWKRSVYPLLVYGDNNTIPKYRTYDNDTNTFSAETSAPTIANGRTFIIRTSPTKTSEAIAGFVDSGGVLNVMCYNGFNWTSQWSVNVGGDGTTRRFDIAYETNSGDAMVLYSTNNTNNNEMAYRTKLGSTECGASNWSSATNLTAGQTNGTVQWIKMAWDRRATQNLITAIWADSASDLSAMVWSGTTWGNEPGSTTENNLERVAASQDSESFDVEYESSSGDVMLAWGTQTTNNNVNGARYRTCTGGTSGCSWNSIQTPPTFSDDATNIDISANPTNDQLVFASIGNQQSDLQAGYWDGSSWSNQANLDSSCNTPIAGSKFISTGWLTSGGTARSIIVYTDNGDNDVDWYSGNGGTFSAGAEFNANPDPNSPERYLDIQMDPQNSDRLMFVVSNSANDLFAKRLVFTAPGTYTWSDSDVATMETGLTQAINSPFSFAFWRN